MPKCESRPISWTGRPTPQAREAGEWYTAELIRAGLLPPDDASPWYAAALPDEEAKGEP